MKYFAVSDIHSFYDELIEGLIEAGFDKNNSEHVLIVNGDVFDRGPKTRETYEFLKSINKDRLILIRGNHEILFLNLSKKSIPSFTDLSNGTFSSFIQLYTDSKDIKDKISRQFFSFANYGYLLYGEERSQIEKELKEQWAKIVKKVTASGVFEWLKSAEWKNFYELDRFIFTHCFIPLRNPFNVPIYNNFNYKDYLFYDSEWRTLASETEWYSAVWGCPWKLFADGLFAEEIKNNKTLVCGHWHTSDFFDYFTGEKDSKRTDIFYSKNLIALDGGVSVDENNELIHDCNVLVIDNGKCFDKHGKELTY